MPAPHSTSSSSNSSSHHSRLSGSRGSRSMEGSGGGSSAGGDGNSSYNFSHQSNSQNSSPFTMARDRFQSSAQQLFKNLEDALGSSRKDLDGTSSPAGEAERGTSHPGASLQPWETALRTMFSSCTTAADQNTVPDAGEVLSPRSSSSNRKRAQAAVVTPNADKNAHSDVAHPSPIVQVEGGPAQKDLGEHIYAQLFFDDQIRAAKAVSGAGRGEGGGIRTASHAVVSPTTAATKQRAAPPPPFPVSTQASRIMLSNSPGAVPTAAEFDLTRTMTFDDSISAISAHTLEAMASANPMMQQQQQRARSGESATLFPPETLLQQQQQQHAQQQQYQNQAREPPAAAAANLGAAPSPFALEHHRSPSSNSRLSKYSHSTRTTESSSFDHWQQEDNKYWTEVAAQGDDPATSRRSARKATHPTPASSSQRKGRIPPSTTNPRSPHRHPHDTTPLYSTGAYDFDPLEVPKGSTSSGGSSRSNPSKAAKKKGPFHRGPHRRAPSEPQFSEI